jgi:hypothetical protein
MWVVFKPLHKNKKIHGYSRYSRVGDLPVLHYKYIISIYKVFMSVCLTIILPVLYGCETWSLTLREERRLRVFENRALRRIFGPKRDDVTGELSKLHNVELHDLYSSPNIVR